MQVVRVLGGHVETLAHKGREILTVIGAAFELEDGAKLVDDETGRFKAATAEDVERGEKLYAALAKAATPAAKQAAIHAALAPPKPAEADA